MKILKSILVAVMLVAATAVPAAAQFRFGPRVGVNVNSMSFDSDVLNSENRAGFTGGVQAEFTIPVVNLAFDLSLMYVHRINNVQFKGNDAVSAPTQPVGGSFRKRDYIEIPLNFKYKFGLPIVGSVLSPYIFTGPSVAFLASKRAINEAYKNKSVDWSWNVGIGLQIVSHLQVSASYGFGMSDNVEKIVNATTSAGLNNTNIEGKNNCWTITAAWLF